MHESLKERFEKHYIPEPNSGCWIWTSALSALGYGRLGLKGAKTQSAHRIFYQLYVGPIPKGLELDHLCRNRCCVNPDHLEPVTHLENIQRGLWGALLPPRSTHCRRGHEYNEENTKWRSKTIRVCMACQRITQLEHKYRNIKAIREKQKLAAREKRRRQSVTVL